MVSNQATLRSIVYSQNFLRNPRLVQSLVDQARLREEDLVVEIGPGRGIITEALADRCRQVIAVEKDEVLASRLRGRLADRPNVQIRFGDFLTFALPCSPYKVFASIPFNVTTSIVAKLTMSPRQPVEAYLIMQREAAERFAGEPGETLFSVLLKPWFEPAIVHHFRRADFAPSPRVDAVMLRLRKRGPPLIARGDTATYRDFVAYVFTAFQPSVYQTLCSLGGSRRAAEILRTVGLSRESTPSRVSFEDWLALFLEFQSTAGPLERACVSGAYRRLRRQQERLVKVHRTRPPPFANAATAGCGEVHLIPGLDPASARSRMTSRTSPPRGSSPTRR